MDVSACIELICTVSAVIVSIIALIQTLQERHLSNNQFLFDERLTIYLVVCQIQTLYTQNRKVLYSDNKDNILLGFMCAVHWLANCDEFKDMLCVFTEEKLKDGAQDKFLSEVAKYKHMANKVKFVFSKEYAFISDYIEEYMNLLFYAHQAYTLWRCVNGYKESMSEQVALQAKTKEWESGQVSIQLIVNIKECLSRLDSLSNQFAKMQSNIENKLQIYR